MFSNCRKYNEVGSMIYEDAKRLEKLLMDKVKELGPLAGSVGKDDSLVKKTPKKWVIEKRDSHDFNYFMNLIILYVRI